MDTKKIKRIIELVEHSRVTELELKDGTDHIRIVCGPAAPEPVPVDEAAGLTGPDGHQVLAPLAGVFHRSAKRGGEPFAAVGASVEEGATLCLIDDDGVTNQIEADMPGRLTAVHVDDGQPVDLGQLLFTVLADGYAGPPGA